MFWSGDKVVTDYFSPLHFYLQGRLHSHNYKGSFPLGKALRREWDLNPRIAINDYTLSKCVTAPLKSVFPLNRPLCFIMKYTNIYWLKW